MQTSAGLIECWHDRFITPGEEWDGVIKAEMEQADVILLLVSAKFLASDYIRGIEIQKAVELATSKKALLIPIVLENCGWQDEAFGKFNALPRKGKPIRDTSPQRNAWYAVEEELRALFKTLRNDWESSASGKQANEIQKECIMAEQLTHLDDRFWNRLLKAIEEGQVVPVVGSQLLTWNDQNSTQSLQQQVAKRGAGAL